MNFDPFIVCAESALRTLSGSAHARRSSPADAHPGEPADPAGKRLAGRLMRVNHVGEVCAQALYQSQALTARSARQAAELRRAGDDETDHLAWTAERLKALGARPSLLNPLWYGGAFLLGCAAGRAGDAISLGFVAETERQVEAHLSSHLERLPDDDLASRAVVEQMRSDEARHADLAESAGGVALPAPVRWLMRSAAKVMTTTAHYL
jgi:ubiquinone biosynthesis monooxygenase Coq7